MTSIWTPIPTPPANSDRQPTWGERESFRYYPNLNNNFTVVSQATAKYNCFGWSVGFDNRWIDGGTPDQMDRLYRSYFYVQVESPAEAEVDLYMKRDAPQMRVIRLPDGTQREIPNLKYNVFQHAHRNDDRHAPLGSTSKMNTLVLIRHNRSALTDAGPWDQVLYGQICGHYRKSSEHPLNPGKEANAALLPNTPPGPESEAWALPGVYPVGHPLQGESFGLFALQGQAAGTNATTTSRLRFYAPYKAIPPPTPAAVDHIRRIVVAMNQKKLGNELIKKFNVNFEAWKLTWFEGRLRLSANSIDRTQVSQFRTLIDMGPSIVPLVVAMLCKPDNFMAVPLYNALEKNTMYKVSAKDAPNYLVLQRHANLIVELNRGRWSK